MSELLWVKNHSDLNCQDTSLLFSSLEMPRSLGNTLGQDSTGGLSVWVFSLRTTESGLHKAQSNYSKYVYVMTPTLGAGINSGFSQRWQMDLLRMTTSISGMRILYSLIYKSSGCWQYFGFSSSPRRADSNSSPQWLREERPDWTCL